MNRRLVFLIFTLLVLFASSLHAAPPEPSQSTPSTPPQDGVDIVVVDPGPNESILDEQYYQAVWAEIDETLATLETAGQLPPLGQSHPLFQWPLRPVRGESVGDFGYWTIANHVDHDPSYPNALLDYACDAMTYDASSGYNHKGTDFLIVPFPWRKMDAEEVAVVAAAPGTIVYRKDGQYDRNCGFSGEQWNAVYVRHDDGSTAWYGHLKAGSVTPKMVGERVTTGEILGLVGSSGNSTTPHLHFEVYDRDRNLIDPFVGGCNATTNTSWWASQHRHKDAAINKLTTGTAAPATNGCGAPESPNAVDQFQPGDRIYFSAYYRHLAPGAHTHYTVRRPDGSIFRQWDYTHQGAHLRAGWTYRSHALDASATTGEWTFSVLFDGRTYEHRFTVGARPTATATSTPSPTATHTPTITPTAPPTPQPTSTPGLHSTIPPLEDPGTDPGLFSSFLPFLHR